MINVPKKFYMVLLVLVFLLVSLSVVLNALMYNTRPEETILLLIPALSGWIFKFKEVPEK